MALDLGEKRIGVALTDGLKLAAHPHSVVQRKSRKEDFETYGEIIRSESVSLVVIGLPRHLNGEEGAMARWARDYGTDLSQKLSVPVTFWDETLTSEMAAAALAEQGLSRKKMKDKIDSVAAALILQSYLESLREIGLD